MGESIMSFHTGLVSISFRRYSVDEIIAACREAGLEWIEWGSDVHVPAGNVAIADEVAAKMKNAGLTTAAYGSYFRLGQHTPAEFEPYMESAKHLGARVIRVWGGIKGSQDTTEEERAKLIEDARAIADMAEAAGLVVTLECHGGTITDDYKSGIAFYEAVDHPALRAYWQPNQCFDEAYNLTAAKLYVPRTECLHVFQWSATARYPLCEGREIWAKYLDIFRPAAKEREIGLLLEFMHDDRLETLAETAKELKSWVEA
jgi:sugar phosphate isomerase/epimerase